MLAKYLKYLYLLLATSLLFATKPVAANESELGIPVGEELILEVHVDKYYLADLIAVKQPQSAYIGLQGLADAIRFPIEVEFDGRAAQGWFFEESNRFELTVGEDQRLYVNVNGQLYEHSSQSYQILDDIYVSPELIAAWFGISLEFDFLQSIVKLSTSRPLPFLAQIIREKRRVSNRLLASKPYKKRDYELWTLPNSNLRFSYRNISNSDNASLSFQGANDVLYHSSTYSINVANLTDDPQLLGFLEFDKNLELSDTPNDSEITRYRFGDIVVANGGVARGVGFEFTNRTTQSYTNTDTIVVDGQIPEGWDVELYRNDVLINNQINVSGGRYVFENVHLFLGVNEIKTILYGPEGQVRETKELYTIDEHRRDNSYIVSLQKLGTDLFSNLNSSTEQGYLFNGSLLTKKLFGQPINFDVQLFDEESKEDLRQRYSASTSFRPTAGSLLTVRLSEEVSNSRSLSTSFNTSFGQQSVNFGLGYGQNLADDEDAVSGSFRFSGPIAQGGNWSVHHQTSFSIRPETENTAEQERRVENNLTLRINRYHVSNRLFWQSNSNDEEILNGGLQLNLPWQGARLRSTLNYTVRPEAELDSVTIGLDNHLFNKFNLSTDASYNFLQSETAARAALTWLQGDVWISGSVNYNTATGYSFGVTAQVGLGVNPLDNTAFTSNRNLSHAGSQIVRVFEDKNFNGVYDGNDILVEGVVVKLPQFSRSESSNTRGMAIFESLPNGHSDVFVEPTSIPDPFLRPTIEGFSIKPRKGVTDVIEYPLVRTSELEGYVRGINEFGAEYQAGGVKIELRNSQGQILASTLSSLDGYYLLTDLMPGEYTLSIPLSSLQKKGLRFLEPQSVSLEAETVKEVNFNVERKHTKKIIALRIGQHSFSSERLLNLYSNRLKQQYFSHFGQNFALSQQKQNGKFGLYYFVSEDETALAQVQNKLLSIGIDAQPEELEIKF